MRMMQCYLMWSPLLLRNIHVKANCLQVIGRSLFTKLMNWYKVLIPVTASLYVFHQSSSRQTVFQSSFWDVIFVHSFNHFTPFVYIIWNPVCNISGKSFLICNPWVELFLLICESACEQFVSFSCCLLLLWKLMIRMKETVLSLSDQGGWYWWDLWRLWGRTEMRAGIGVENWRNEITWKA
jgi:hypothetical protein